MDYGKSQRTVTNKITVWGIVQGVGFRPYIVKLAKKYGVKGQVRNLGGMVEILAQSDYFVMKAFLEAIKKEKPGPAEIIHMEVEKIEDRETLEILAAIETGLVIKDSGYVTGEPVMLPQDLAICPACLRELQDKNNRRYRHPYISCMVCGPRYSIIDQVPYDRVNTAMSIFPMCKACEAEYTSVDNRRYHAQTISCNDCGPINLYQDRNLENKVQKEETAFIAGIKAIKAGKIVGVKGIGGYHLCCSPFDEDAILNLRNLKNREEKPFAVMFSSVENIRKYCCVSEIEERILNSTARPIVLVENKKNQENIRVPIHPSVYKISHALGAFLPSTPLHYLLLEACGPLIMTSANFSGMPIIKEDEEMLALMAKKTKIQGVLYNKRDIRVRLDDSVIRIIDGKPQWIRRSKGYAPVPIYTGTEKKESLEYEILGLGGDLKSSFALSKQGFAYLSQFLGDLDEVDNLEVYKENIDRMGQLLDIHPTCIVGDSHPKYKTYAYFQKLKHLKKAKFILAQHHHSHIASVMAEYGINEPIIGVAYDGTGYGLDGTVWGGEFLLCHKGSFKRVGHLETIDVLGGDKLSKEGWRYVACLEAQYTLNLLDPCFQKEPWKDKVDLIKAACKGEIGTIKTSSMGRLFDGISAILDISSENKYEGYSAILLENKGRECLEKLKIEAKKVHKNVTDLIEDKVPKLKFTVETTADCEKRVLVKLKDLLITVAEAKKRTEFEPDIKEKLALSFHLAVAEMTVESCLKIREKERINKVALSGGVFQNKLLLEETLKKLREEKFQVFYNKSVPCNDGGISLGQVYIGQNTDC